MLKLAIFVGYFVLLGLFAVKFPNERPAQIAMGVFGAAIVAVAKPWKRGS